MLSDKQKAALKRGMYIRNTRGCIALIRSLINAFPTTSEGYQSLLQAEVSLTRWHHRQFGNPKCLGCGKELDGVFSSFCRDNYSACVDAYSKKHNK